MNILIHPHAGINTTHSRGLFPNGGGKKITIKQFSMNNAENKHLLQVCKPVQSPIEIVVKWIEGKRKQGKAQEKE